MPFGLVFNLKTTAIAVAIALAVGGIGGWRTHKKFADSAQLTAITKAYRQKVTTLEDRVKQVNAAAQNDQTRAATAEAKRKEAEERANALQSQIVDGACFTDDDTDRLRELWSAGPAARKPR